MLDVLGYITTPAVAAFIIAALTLSISASRPTRFALAGGLSLWFGVATAAGASGLLAATGRAPPMGAFVAIPLIAGLVASAWADGRRVMLSLPLKVILALNVLRLLGFYFVLLGWAGRLGGPFPVSAGWGDTITGLGAAALLVLGAERRPRLVFAWNLFGLADLVAAIVLGVTSAEGAPQQLFHTPPGSAAMQLLPWSLVPSLLVPFWIVMHAIVWAQLRTRRA
jgi:hypothetical protein